MHGVARFVGGLGLFVVLQGFIESGLPSVRRWVEAQFYTQVFAFLADFPIQRIDSAIASSNTLANPSAIFGHFCCSSSCVVLIILFRVPISNKMILAYFSLMYFKAVWSSFFFRLRYPERCSL